MQHMKRWHKRTLCILALGIAGIVALAYRTAFEEDRAETIDYFNSPSIKLSSHDANHDICFEHRWNLSQSPRGTVQEGSLQPNAFGMIQPAEWLVKIYTKNGHLCADFTPPVIHATDPTGLVKTHYYAYFTRPTWHYCPNGSMVAEYNLCLHCDITITPAWWRSPITTRAIQVLNICPALGCADLTTAYTAALSDDTPRQIITDAPEAELPARFCGTQREQALQFLLYEFADAALGADTERLQQFYRTAQEYTEQLTTADKDWPACWEEAAEQARRAAQLAERTLTIIQENNCYDSEELANFINGPVFARIFGNQLQKREKLDFGNDFGSGLDNIDFEVITEDDFDSPEE